VNVRKLLNFMTRIQEAMRKGNFLKALANHSPDRKTFAQNNDLMVTII
jgi:hypothetical protein